jgi:hypothetical protein
MKKPLRNSKYVLGLIIAMMTASTTGFARTALSDDLSVRPSQYRESEEVKRFLTAPSDETFTSIKSSEFQTLALADIMTLNSSYQELAMGLLQRHMNLENNTNLLEVNKFSFLLAIERENPSLANQSLIQIESLTSSSSPELAFEMVCSILDSYGMAIGKTSPNSDRDTRDRRLSILSSLSSSHGFADQACPENIFFAEGKQGTPAEMISQMAPTLATVPINLSPSMLPPSQPQNSSGSCTEKDLAKQFSAAMHTLDQSALPAFEWMAPAADDTCRIYDYGQLIKIQKNQYIFYPADRLSSEIHPQQAFEFKNEKEIAKLLIEAQKAKIQKAVSQPNRGSRKP